MILDVGCGSNAIGDINIDPFLPETVKPKKIHWRSKKTIPNFVLGVGEFLPFRNHIFDLVIAWASLEHSQNMQKFFLELIRVSKNEIQICVPHRFSKHKKVHFHYFTSKYFIQACMYLMKKKRVLGYRIKHDYRYIPHKFLPFFQMPNAIQITIWVYRNNIGVSK